MRTKSLSSPTPPIVSGKSSPCPNYSGKSSPCPTIEENDPHRRPRVKLLNLIQSVPQDTSSPSVIRPPIYVKPPTDNYLAPPVPTASPAIVPVPEDDPLASFCAHNTSSDVSRFYADDEPCVQVCDQYCQTDLEDENLTLVQWRAKYEPHMWHFTSDMFPETTETVVKPVEETSIVKTLADTTTAQLNQMESQFLAAELEVKAARSPDHVPIRPTPVETPTKKMVPKYSSILNRSVTAGSTLSATSRVGHNRQPTTGTSIRTTPPGVARNLIPLSKLAGPSLGPRRPDQTKVAKALAAKPSNSSPAIVPQQVNIL